MYCVSLSALALLFFAFAQRLQRRLLCSLVCRAVRAARGTAGAAAAVRRPSAERAKISLPLLLVHVVVDPSPYHTEQQHVLKREAAGAVATGIALPLLYRRGVIASTATFSGADRGAGTCHQVVPIVARLDPVIGDVPPEKTHTVEDRVADVVAGGASHDNAPIAQDIKPVHVRAAVSCHSERQVL